MKERIENVKSVFPKGRTALMAALHEVQSEYGWLHPEGLKLVEEILGYSETEIFSLASFYHYFHLEPAPRYKLHICTNITCMQKGAYDLLKEAVEKADPKKVLVDEVECIGLCDHAPAALLNGTPLHSLDRDRLLDVLEHPENYDRGYRATYGDLKGLYGE